MNFSVEQQQQQQQQQQQRRTIAERKRELALQSRLAAAPTPSLIPPLAEEKALEGGRKTETSQMEMVSRFKENGNGDGPPHSFNSPEFLLAKKRPAEVSPLGFERKVAALSAPLGREKEEEKEKIRDSGEDMVEQTEKDTSPEAIQEIVAQYKADLCELTVNSKIIITRLTIIAGDNIHAAKGIATAICTHILEVPSDQKLPCLYLLDSIVKNIGREFIDLFAARLPEVFGEAYRQVDPSLHPKMKRLFETWREVFPGDPLFRIEAKLQFNSVPSTSLTASRPTESPPQRPGHGIHVNPSYLEAQRQRLQQASELPAISPEKDSFASEFRARKSFGDSFLDYDYVCTDIGAKIGKERSRSKEEPWEKGWPKDDTILRPTNNELEQQYGHGSVYEARQSTPRLLIDAYGNIRVPPALKNPPAAPTVIQRDRGQGRGPWQEQSTIWDEKVPRLMDNDRNWETSRRGNWYPGDVDKDLTRVGLGKATGTTDWHHDTAMHSMSQQSNISFQRDQHENSLMHQEAGIGISANLEARSVPPYPLSPRASPPLQRLHSPHFIQPGALPPSLHMQVSTRPPLHPQSIVTSHVSTQQPVPSPTMNPTQWQGHINVTSMAQTVEQKISMHQPLHEQQFRLPFQPSKGEAGTASLDQALQPPQLPQSSTALPISADLLNSLKQLQASLQPLKSHPEKHTQILKPDHVYVKQAPQSLLEHNIQPSQFGQVEKASESVQLVSQGQQPSQLLTAFLSSGITGLQPQLMPSGHAQFGFPVTTVSLPTTQSVIAPVSAPLQPSQQPPLPPGPPPSSQVVNIPLQPMSNITSLLSSLMAQGVISPLNSLSQPKVVAATTTVSSQNFNATAESGKASLNFQSATVTEVSLEQRKQESVGLEFKPEVLRERRDSILHDLYPNALEQCKICGLRCKSQGDLVRHTDWHASRDCNRVSEMLSRGWYEDKEEWIKGTDFSAFIHRFPSGVLADESSLVVEEEEPSVLANENQPTCTLCGEPFEDFYSDEKEEWMYKGAVYMNTDSSMDKGSIVHAKCLSNSDIRGTNLLETEHELEHINKKVRF